MFREGNQETARMIEELGGRAFAGKCDVSRAEDVKAALAGRLEEFGRLDVAFNNRGDFRDHRAGMEPHHPYQSQRRVSVHEIRDSADA
jgi:NAD(P)-dependent dehydrogenase (short-subunit alcohol dehydrogenase family)